jgi:tetratricopeptide (TPR) repeat protein
MADFAIQLETAPDGSVTVRGRHADQPSAHIVPAVAVAAVRRQSTALLAAFENRQRPWVDPVSLADFGRLLHATFLAPLGDLTAHGAHDSLRLLFTSSDPACLNLPWELLPGGDGQFLVADARCTIRRTPRASLPAATLPLVAPPLRVLFAACAPIDQPGLDYEKEEEAILRIAHRLGAAVHLEFAEAGTFDELRDLISEYRPHVVHLSGHGSVRDGVGSFAFENERGLCDSRDAREMAAQLFAGRGVRLVFVNGCQTAQVAVAGVCQTLTATGHVPLALGWGASIADDRATDFARVFFHELAAGRPVDLAVATARCDLLARCRVHEGAVELLDASFALPQLHAADGSDAVVDHTMPAQPPRRPGVSYRLLPDNIRGLREGFVGRRRQLQRTRPALRTGEKNIVLFTGIGGAGKSTLATRLANRLERDGWHLVALRAKAEDELPFAVRLLDQLATACLFFDALKPFESVLRDGRRDTTERLRIAVELLNRERLLLVLDNLESLMRPDAPGQWREPEFAAIFQELVARLTGQGRAILTCRYVPGDCDSKKQSNLAHEVMPEFTWVDFNKYLRRHQKVAGRIERRELTSDLIAMFYLKLGATPSFVEQACAILGTLDADALAEQLEALAAPEPDTAGDDLWRLQQAYFRDLFLPQLYETLSPPSQLALSRLSLVFQELPLDGVARVAGIEPAHAADFARRCVGIGLLQRFGEGDEVALFAVYPVLREFLTSSERLPLAERQSGHLAAAKFFREAFEQEHMTDVFPNFATLLGLCAIHYDDSSDLDGRIWADSAVASWLVNIAEYAGAMGMVERLLTETRHPDLVRIVRRCAMGVGDWVHARTLALEELELRRERLDTDGEGDVWHALGLINSGAGDNGTAREDFLKALAMYKSRGARDGELAALSHLASLDMDEGRYAEARGNLEIALSGFQALRNKRGESSTWHKLGVLAAHESNFTAARECIDNALKASRHVFYKKGEAAALAELGALDALDANFPEARQKLEEALSIYRKSESRTGEASTLLKIGVVALKAGQGKIGIRLLAVSMLDLQAASDSNQDHAVDSFKLGVAKLGLSAEEESHILRDAAEALQRDRGAELVRQAFATL